MAKFLIINADDFGLSVAANECIMQAHACGTVTSTTLMANMPGFEHAAALARSTPSLGVGLHVNLTIGKPLSPKEEVPSLVGPEGYFSDKRNGWREEEVELEVGRQLSKLLAAGLHPTHLDSHHHIHIEVPAVYKVVTTLALRHRLAVRLHPWAVRSGNGPLSTNRLILDTFDGDDGVSRLIAHIAGLGNGVTELMCHPGSPEPNQSASGGGSDKRTAELLALTDPRVRDALRHGGIRLIHFGQLSPDHIALPGPGAVAPPAAPEAEAATTSVSAPKASQRVATAARGARKPKRTRRRGRQNRRAAGKRKTLLVPRRRKRRRKA